MHVEHPCILDIEASGFGPFSYPIEVGIVMSSGEKYCSLILPSPDWTYWDKEAEEVHHVSREILEEHGKPMADVANQLNKHLAGQTIYSDGWVVDQPWLTSLFYAANISQQFRLSALEMILSEDQMHVWHDTRDIVTRELGLTRHRASTDAVIIQQTYIRTHTNTNGT
ncbi:MAG: hypothetical protein BMS9Abin26_1423 [Gammaproteobacteria bacterium]|nr:MAG: hypothetical protein BMS9Abin26_1423 [Gammaproteobacteria bacterium]